MDGRPGTARRRPPLVVAGVGASISPMQERCFDVPASDAGTRLDVWLEDQLEDLTRSGIGRLIKDGYCELQPGQAKPGLKLRGGEQIHLRIPEPEQLDIVAEDIPLSILFEDDDLLLIDKPPDMVVHPSPGHPRGTLLGAVLGHLGGGEPALVHRLDEDTSGVIAVAKNPQAHTFCQAAFQQRQVRKCYLALAHGRLKADVLENQRWLTRHGKDFRKRCACEPETPGAKSARTTIVVRERHDGYCVVEARPSTGRTHQVRVHLADLGHAVLADRYYSRSKIFPVDGGSPQLERQGLHAWALDLPHPRGGRVQVQAVIPDDMRVFLADPELQPMEFPVAPGLARLVDEDEPHG